MRVFPGIALALTSVLVGSAFIFACSDDASPPPERGRVVIGTSTEGGGFLAFGRALEPELRHQLKTFDVDLRVSRGAVDNLSAVQRRDFDCGFTYAEVAFEAAAIARVGADNGSRDGIRAIGTLQVTPVQLVAGRSSGLGGLQDLRGKRVALGAEGSATLLVTQLLLQAYQLEGKVTRIPVSLTEAVHRLTRGELDAVFDTAIFSEAVATAVASGGYLVPIEGAAVDALREERPFLRPTTIPSGTYRSISVTVPTIGMESLLVCSAGLSDAVAYELTDALIAALRNLAGERRWNLVSMDQVPATSVPLHPGASLYYRQAELMH